jgi:alkylation response protein AidB-like acyl-CoA dehydrogenase
MASCSSCGAAGAPPDGDVCMSELLEELDDWLSDNWDADLTVGEWWERLGLAGWAHPSLPSEAYGKGVSRPDALAVSARIAQRSALGPPAGLGMALAAPTIATHGTPEQVDALVRPIVTGQRAWCQLFSEPGAGSDLAGLSTRAVRDGDEWVVNGQKVWTSGGQIADMGMLVARTNPDAPKHQGITWFAFDMHQGGAVEVRPLREMTGRALFNEVFISDARVPDAWVVGGTNNGWAVANTTLTFERQGLSAGGQGHAALALPGTVVGDVAKRAGDFVRPRGPGSGGAGAMVAGSEKLFIDLARANGRIGDPTVRQQLMKLHTLTEIARFTNMRTKAERARGRELPGVGNLGKLAMSEVVRTSRDLGLAILGPLGTLHAYSPDERKELDAATGEPKLAFVTEMALFAQAPPIYGGTDQVQRNIVGERVLGLPKEPSDDRIKPWSELPRNG